MYDQDLKKQTTSKQGFLFLKAETLFLHQNASDSDFRVTDSKYTDRYSHR